jgi:Tfp pilus assembly protein PilZ
MYKLFTTPDGKTPVGVIFNGIVAIPFDPDNTDYQAYLKFIEDGGIPLPADGATL